ncbi:MAG: hypothetical protein NTV86_22745 [Planctomycetota bacterium]|nr:hypothetical protein [Planctomycetota bacterium]
MPRHVGSTVKPLSPRAGAPARRRVWWCAALIVAAGAGAWCNSFQGPFLFDDEGAIVANPTIRRLWPIGPVLTPPAQGQAAQRRPVANVSLAIDYAISGLDVWSYHATNLAVHLLAGLTLLGVVRRTLDSPRLRVRFGGHSLGLATTVAGLWVLHPLQTEAVTYVIQRTEVLAGLFYLLTLYAVIRGAHSPTPRRWYAAAVAACLLAMGSKESAVSAPLVVLLYDRLFLGERWAQVWGRRWGLYAGLAATWGLVLVLVPHGQEGTQIFGVAQARTQYARAQGEAVVRYLAFGRPGWSWTMAPAPRRTWPVPFPTWRSSGRSWLPPSWRCGGGQAWHSWASASSPSWPPVPASCLCPSRWPPRNECTCLWPPSSH